MVAAKSLLKDPGRPHIDLENHMATLSLLFCIFIYFVSQLQFYLIWAKCSFQTVCLTPDLGEDVVLYTYNQETLVQITYPGFIIALCKSFLLLVPQFPHL